MMRGSIAAVTLLGLAACTTAPESDGGEGVGEVSPFATDQSRPLLALFDHLLGNYFASDVGARPTICVASHDGRSEVALPAAEELELMTRYGSLAPFARCGFVDGRWQDTETGETAMLFRIHSFTCANEANCTGFGGYVSGQTSSLSSRYTMQYADGAWQFDRDDRLIGEE
ncbi:hypothetical protein [Alteraurantiacibacter aquimixticola]|uniref:Lipoprotein n=1 Tax=Alteraurantiacibacter aquimixticola TaxID=2489173 RepID=A0A4T3F015_9SPHN|nr:hypothetical protein [Alteraurantiacibacter aquimixticola]TIX50254.1 hypothetical protein E5222_08185 [Alteraurantiacibacter aquimixticola]